MARYSDLLRLDLTEIGRRALAAGAAALADAARRRVSGGADTIAHALTQDDRATVWVSGLALVRRERGDVGLTPSPFLAPDTADRHAVREAITESLRKDLT